MTNGRGGVAQWGSALASRWSYCAPPGECGGASTVIRNWELLRIAM